MESSRTVFSGVVVITLAVVIMILAASTFLNAMCQSTFDTNLPIYPDAQIVNQRFPFLGDKWMQLYIPVGTTEVRTHRNQCVSVCRLSVA